MQNSIREEKKIAKPDINPQYLKKIMVVHNKQKELIILIKGFNKVQEQ